MNGERELISHCVGGACCCHVVLDDISAAFDALQSRPVGGVGS